MREVLNWIQVGLKVSVMIVIIIFVIAFALILWLVLDYYFENKNALLRERLLSDIATINKETDIAVLDNKQPQKELVIERKGFIRLSQDFDHVLKKTGLKINKKNLILYILFLAFVISGIVFYFANHIVLSICIIILIPLIFIGVLKKLADYQTNKHNDQLSAFTTHLISTLRSGGTALQAMQSTVTNAPSPLKESIAEILDQIQIGISPNDAWKEWGLFWNTNQTKMLSLGIRLKWDSGGEMSRMLTYILDALEFKRRMNLRVNTITTQAKMSAYILTAMPFLIGMLIFSIRPQLFQETIHDPLGQKILLVTFAAIMVGFVWLRKIAKLES